VNIETAEPEFRAWRWAEPKDLPDIIVPFKRALYRNPVRGRAVAFGQHLV
jgi:putative (di)nucleoside polyphosphate hydrolase